MFKWLLALFGRPKQSDVQLLRQQIESQQRDLVARGLQLNASSTQLQQSKDEIDRLLGLIPSTVRRPDRIFAGRTISNCGAMRSATRRSNTPT